MNRSVTQSGFTLVEMIVSLALFSVVITIAVGALLVLIASNERFQEEQSVMTNLSFAIDSMTREIRTGVNYFCDSQDSANGVSAGQRIFQNGQDLSFEPTQDCQNGNSSDRRYHGISFVEGGQSITGSADTRIVYFFDDTEGKIYRRVSGNDAQSIVSSGIFIENAEFFVTGSDPLSDGSSEIDQATVSIVIEARETDSAADSTYNIQTTVVQRTLDI